MELREAIQLRRSTAPITDEAPTQAELVTYLALASHAPDHASLRPWRLVTLRGTERNRLGTALAAGFGDESGSVAEQRSTAKPLRAPLLIGLISSPVPHPKVPRWEQEAAAVAMVTTLQLVMFEAGWTTFWRSGPATELTPVLELMGVTASERLLGWLYTGATATVKIAGPKVSGTNAAAVTVPDAATDDSSPTDLAAKISALPG